jgi:hypothetical protein
LLAFTATMLGANDTREGPSRGELQDDLMRFEGRFAARLLTAYEPLVESSDPSRSLRAARDELGFMSAALDIAVGSAPEVDLLDMFTLVSLGGDAMSRRWGVETAGDAARAVADAFRVSLEDISAVAAAVLTPQLEAELHQVIGDWHRENPDHDDVAGVRLSAYARFRASSNASSGGLFALLRGATQTADTAVLLGDRALYATQRMPFLVRLHTRIAGREILGEARQATNQVLFKAALSCAGVAAAAATSWLVANWARRLLGSWA